MKIYYASQSFYPHIGGVSTYLLNLAKEMVNKGNDVVEVHLRPSGEGSKDEIKGIQIRRVPREPIDPEIMKSYSKFKDVVYTECHRQSQYFTKPVQEIPGFMEFNKVNEYFGEAIKDLLEENPADIVHIHDFQLLFAYKYVPRGTALVFTWHIPFRNGISKQLSDFLIKNLKEYDRVVFSSPEYIQQVVNAGLPREKTSLIYPIANTNIFHVMNIEKKEVLKKFNIPQDAKVILCVQRIDYKSGHEQLIRAMPLVLKKVPKAKLVFVGGKSLSNNISNEREAEEKKVNNLITELNLEKDIFFTGNVDYYLLPELYNSADIVALCSRNEGFGLSITEAMACGKPIIGTNIGGIPIQVKDNENGFLVEVGDFENTAESIIKLLKADTLRKKMGDKSLEIVQEKFRMELGIERHIALYNDVKKEKDEFHRIEYLNISDIKAIISDLDRTLTDEPAGVTFDPKDFDKDLFDELSKLGIDLFLATGRPIDYVIKLCRHFDIWRCVVAENGCVLYFPPTKKVITIDTDYIKTVRKIIKKAALPGTVIGRVITSNNISYEDDIIKLIGNLINHVKLVRNVNEIMILPKGVDKGFGIRLALQYLNIDINKTIVIGEGENDVDMFLNPGFKIALANSAPKLKKFANQITENKSKVGIREIIKKLIK